MIPEKYSLRELSKCFRQVSSDVWYAQHEQELKRGSQLRDKYNFDWDAYSDSIDKKMHEEFIEDVKKSAIAIEDLL